MMEMSLTRRLGFGLVALLAVWALSWLLRDRLPPDDAILRLMHQDPAQTPTVAQPFTVERGGTTYTVTPLYDYTLHGVVVSSHDAGSWLDVSHGRWGDALNIKDFCVVWGGNLVGGTYRRFSYSSGEFTCFYQTGDNEAWLRFSENQLSNNHLLAANPAVAKAIGEAAVGDQIYLRGQLATYAHAGGFKRSSSTNRTDRGNGACETVFVHEFTVLRQANAPWRWAHRVSGWGLALGGLLWLALALRGLTRSETVTADEYLARGNELAMRGKHQRAEAAFSRAIAQDPALAPAYRDRAQARDALGRFAEAEADRAEADRLEMRAKLLL